MKKVKRMMFGGAAKAVGNAAKSAAAKAPALGVAPSPTNIANQRAMNNLTALKDQGKMAGGMGSGSNLLLEAANQRANQKNLANAAAAAVQENSNPLSSGKFTPSKLPDQAAQRPLLGGQLMDQRAMAAAQNPALGKQPMTQNQIGRMLADRVAGNEQVQRIGTAAKSPAVGQGINKNMIGAALGKKMGMKKGGAVKASSASKRGDGCAIKGKTKGRMV
jgi:hypothetical protein